MVLGSTSWEWMTMGYVSTSQGVPDQLPLLSPLGCLQHPVIGARAVCEQFHSPQEIPRPEALQGMLAKLH